MLTFFFATVASSLVDLENIDVSKQLSLLQSWLATNGIKYLFSLLIAVMTFFLGRFGIRFLIAMLRKTLSKATKLNPLLVKLVLSTVEKVSWALVIMSMLNSVGLDMTPLLAGLGLTGVIVGFAFQDSLANIASGLMIALNHPFKVGDYVQLNGNDSGTVRELNMMATTIATIDNKIIIIPNKLVWGSAITNYTDQELRRVDLVLSVAYGSNIKVVLSTLNGLAKSNTYILQDEPTIIEVGALSGSSVDIHFRVWVKSTDYWAAFYDLNQASLKTLEDAGIEIPFPQLVVHQANGS